MSMGSLSFSNRCQATFSGETTVKIVCISCDKATTFFRRSLFFFFFFFLVPFQPWSCLLCRKTNRHSSKLECRKICQVHDHNSKLLLTFFRTRYLVWVGVGGNLGVNVVRVCESVFRNLPHSFSWPLKKQTHSYTSSSKILTHSYTALWLLYPFIAGS